MIAQFLEARGSDFSESFQWNQCFPLELCCRWHGQLSSNPITSCIGNARLSRFKLMFCGLLLGESPLVSTPFTDLTVRKILESVTPTPRGKETRPPKLVLRKRRNDVHSGGGAL
jgi:hypothetical protein